MRVLHCSRHVVFLALINCEGDHTSLCCVVSLYQQVVSDLVEYANQSTSHVSKLKTKSDELDLLATVLNSQSEKVTTDNVTLRTHMPTFIQTENYMHRYKINLL